MEENKIMIKDPKIVCLIFICLKMLIKIYSRKLNLSKESMNF